MAVDDSALQKPVMCQLVYKGEKRKTAAFSLLLPRKSEKKWREGRLKQVKW